MHLVSFYCDYDMFHSDFMAPASNDEPAVKAQLLKLRDAPETTPSETILFLIFDYLIGPLPSKTTHIVSYLTDASSSRKHQHWFCSHAGEVVTGAATFLLRLHAYTSPRVELWRKELKACLRECCECVRELQSVKLSSRHTYVLDSMIW